MTSKQVFIYLRNECWRGNTSLNYLFFNVSHCRQITQTRSSFFTTTSDDSETLELRSKRHQFRDIPVNASILKYIETIGVGIPPRLSKRRCQQWRPANFASAPPKRRSRGSAGSISLPCTPPAPFGGKNSVKVVRRVESLETLQFPVNADIPEVALAGRSNVGKSTLLNALLYGNKSILADDSNKTVKEYRGRMSSKAKLPKGVKAITSNRPGETRQITFYQLSERDITTTNNTHNQEQKSQQPQQKEVTEKRATLWLVDLPGYGFAFSSEQDKIMFQEMIATYLLQRGKTLKRVLLLIDARHGMKKADLEFCQSLEQRCNNNILKMPSIQIVLTKCDLVLRADLARRIVQVREQLSDALRREVNNLPVMLVSALPGKGYNNVLENRALGGVMELQKNLASLILGRKKK